MDAEFSTHPAKSQGLSAVKPSSKLPFYWLVFSALLWGTPIVLFLYIPLSLIEKTLPKKSRPRALLYAARKRLFSSMVYSYLKMQRFFNPCYELEELKELEKNKEKFLLVSNHRSHLDVFLFLSKIDGLQVVAKKALFSVPILNIMMILTKQIPAEKGDWKSLEKATQIMRERLNNGERVLVFPEFKRCEANFMGINSYSMLPFQIAIQEGLKVLPMVVHGTDSVWPKGSLHFRVKKQVQRVVALEAIDAKNFESAKDLRDKVYNLSQNKFKELNTLEL
jgi:1-acyl-sn-glycerol-3-phosphate acyltransferase